MTHQQFFVALSAKLRNLAMWVDKFAD